MTTLPLDHIHNIWAVPSFHYQLAFAQTVRKAFAEVKPTVVALGSSFPPSNAT